MLGAIVSVAVGCRPTFPDGATLGVASSGPGPRIWWPAATDPDAGGSVASYRIDVDGEPLVTVPGGARTCTLTGLPPGAHDVRITALDVADEWSGDSSPGGAVTGSVTASEPSGDPPGCVPITAWNSPGTTTTTSVSGDGRYVAALGDAGPYVWDRLDGESQSLDRPASHAYEDAPEISADGRFVVFVGPTDPSSPGPSTTWPIQVWDRTTGAVEPVPGPPAGHRLLEPAISGDGRSIVFTALSPATASPGDHTADQSSEIWLWDRTTGGAGPITSGDGISGQPDIADDGSVVVFTSGASNLVEDAWDGDFHIYRYDVASGAVIRIPHARHAGVTSMTRLFPTVSGDGESVAFAAWSGPPSRYQLLVWDRGATEATQAGPSLSGYWHRDISMSGDGSSIVFDTPASAIVPGETSSTWDVFVWDRDRAALTRITDGDQLSYRPTISADGDVVTFISGASNLLGAPGQHADLFAWDRTDQPGRP